MICKKTIKDRFRRSFDKSYNEDAVVQQQIAVELVSELSQIIPRLSAMFEFGCGTGILTSKLLQAFNPEIVYLNDLTDTSKLIAGLPESFTFIAGDAETIDYPRNLDLVASNAVIQWFQDLPGHFSRVHNALNEGGFLAFTTFGPDNMREIRELTGSGLNYHTAEDLFEMLDGEFEVVSCQEFSRILYFDSAKEVLMHLKKTGVNAIGKRSWSKSQYKEFCSCYETRFALDHKFPVTYHPIIIIARKK